MDQNEYWDSVANKKSFFHPVRFEILEKFINKDALILDYGCGYGRIINELTLHNYKNIFGCDFSESMIQRGKRNFPELNFTKTTSLKAPYNNNQFDAVILFTVLTCVASSDDQQALIKELHRVLKTDGIIYISDLLINTDDEHIKRYTKFEKKYKCYGIFELDEGGLFRHHSKEWIFELLKEYDNKWYSEFMATTMNGNKSKAFQFIGSKKV